MQLRAALLTMDLCVTWDQDQQIWSRLHSQFKGTEIHQGEIFLGLECGFICFMHVTTQSVLGFEQLEDKADLHSTLYPFLLCKHTDRVLAAALLNLLLTRASCVDTVLARWSPKAKTKLKCSRITLSTPLKGHTFIIITSKVIKRWEDCTDINAIEEGHQDSCDCHNLKPRRLQTAASESGASTNSKKKLHNMAATVFVCNKAWFNESYT